MREFTCVICGAKGIDRSAKGCRIYCSTACANKARYCKSRNEVEAICLYNEGVQCARQHCSNCGWNPAVEQQRKEMLQKRRRVDK